MSESLSIDEGWEEPLDSDQVTHVKGEAVTATAASGEWLVNVSEQVVVPMTTTDVVEALRARRITGRSLVWRNGMQDWTALDEVPPLRLAAGPLATQPARPPAPLPAPRAAQPERPQAAAPERMLHPPPKEPARAARDERRRRNTLPFGFPVVRDPASVRQPTGLHAHSAAAVPAQPEPSSRPRTAEVEALAIYERATPSLTFSDSVRAEWQGTTGLVHQPAANAAPPSAFAGAPSVAPSRPEPKFEPKPKLSLEPQSDPKPRLSLEPQSDPMQSARVEAQLKVSVSQPPNSLAPTTSEPEHEPPVRGAGLWGDLSVVLASDLRAVQATSKRVTLIASIGSAALASLLTLWFAHSSRPRAPEAAPAAQAQAVEAPAKAEVAAAPSVAVVVVPAASLTQPAVPALTAHTHTPTPVSAASAALVRPAPKPAVAAAPRVVARPKPAPVPEAESAAPNVAADSNPYADSPDHSQPKTPTAAFKEASATPAAPKPDTDAIAPSVASGLEDSAKPVHPAPTATPGF